MKKLTKRIVIAIVAAITLGIAERGKFNDRYMASRYYDGYAKEDTYYVYMFAPKYVKDILRDANQELNGSAKYSAFDTVRVAEYAFTACDSVHVLVRTRSEKSGDSRGRWFKIDEEGRLYYDSDYNDK